MCPAASSWIMACAASRFSALSLVSMSAASTITCACPPVLRIPASYQTRRTPCLSILARIGFVPKVYGILACRRPCRKDSSSCDSLRTRQPASSAALHGWDLYSMMPLPSSDILPYVTWAASRARLYATSSTVPCTRRCVNLVGSRYCNGLEWGLGLGLASQLFSYCQ